MAKRDKDLSEYQHCCPEHLDYSIRYKPENGCPKCWSVYLKAKPSLIIRAEDLISVLSAFGLDSTKLKVDSMWREYLGLDDKQKETPWKKKS